MWFTWGRFVWALIGAFGTAFVYQHTGRDPRQGGWIGLGVGLALGPLYLLGFWIWLYYTRLNVYLYKETQPWYLWFVGFRPSRASRRR